MFWPVELPEAEVDAEDESLHRARVFMVSFTLGAIVLAVVLGIIHDEPNFPKVDVAEAHLSLTQDGAQPVTTVDREAAERIYLHVTLRHAPVGERLALDCRWIDPQGRAVLHDRFRTHPIHRPMWTAVSEHRLPAGAPAGRWAVRMSLADRTLCEVPLQLRAAER